jgi:hypothetical protein
MIPIPALAAIRLFKLLLLPVELANSEGLGLGLLIFVLEVLVTLVLVGVSVWLSIGEVELGDPSPRLEEENGIGLVVVRFGGVGEVCEGVIWANLVPNNVKNRVIEGCKV